MIERILLDKGYESLLHLFLEEFAGDPLYHVEVDGQTEINPADFFGIDEAIVDVAGVDGCIFVFDE